ncbi:hypothetical protein GCWU000342_00402 [Shuttleworthella satelles DSM 14600]|uniref:Uncharacterized protein n=1 Tax=Shuttleworthella satelles DSM 14600 TaxID=626523 RepID=C4G8V6_9FIRM|nr:hypothetical protein GCWU000342_00402 [Shuttleworthia satelles DSM 14600]
MVSSSFKRPAHLIAACIAEIIIGHPLRPVQSTGAKIRMKRMA